MLPNTRVTAFTISDLLRQSQEGGELPPAQVRVKITPSIVKLDCGTKIFGKN